MNVLLYIPEIFGLSIEVYVIGLILGIPVFLFWRWVFGKRQITKVNKRIATWVATILFTPVLYVGIVCVCVFIYFYYPNRDFDEKGWTTNKDERYEYSKDIIESKMLIGKSKKEVRAILGDVENKDGDNTWKYNLGYKPDSMIDRDWLDIEFEKGKVVSVSQFQE